MGSKITAIEYVKAQRLRQAFAQGMRALMQQVDMLALPTLPILPPRRDQLDQPIRLGDQEYEPGATMLRFTFLFNLTGQPALSLPCGFSTSRLPIGLQLVGRHHEETAILCTGHAYRQATDWHLRQPS